MNRRRPFPIGQPPPGYRVFRGLGGESHRSTDPIGIRPDGTPGNFVDPYQENRAWGNTGAGGGFVAPPLIGGGPGIGLPPGLATTPFGIILGPDGKPLLWKNPTTFASVPIIATTAANPPTPSPNPVLSLNYARNLLTIQNNSIAPTAGDIAPTMYVGFNAAPQIGISLGLAPGVGITYDVICPRDSIYIIFGTFTNTGGSVVIFGTIVQGTYSP